jgi:hypothetical protein
MAHVKCVRILGMHSTENLLALHWLRMENNMKALTFRTGIVRIQRRRKFKIQSKITNNLNPVTVVISFHGTASWHFIHLDCLMRRAALIFHHAAMLVWIRQQGLCECSFLWWKLWKHVRGQDFACCWDTWLKECRTHTEDFLNNKSGSIKLSEVQCIVGEDGHYGVRCSAL